MEENQVIKKYKIFNKNYHRWSDHIFAICVNCIICRTVQCTLHNKSIDHRFVINSLKDGYSGFQLSRFLIFEQLYFLPSTPSPPVNLISGPPLKILNILIMSGGLFLQELTPFTNIQFIIRNLNLEEKKSEKLFWFHVN